MKIRNNTPANLSVPSQSSNGLSHKFYLTVPGESTLELPDDEWRYEYAKPAEDIVAAGHWTIIEPPKPTKEELDEAKAKAVADAKKLLAEEPKPVK